MQTRKAVGPNLSSLELTSEASDRFVYQSRFVPFILRDKSGRPVATVLHESLQLRRERQAERFEGRRGERELDLKSKSTGSHRPRSASVVVAEPAGSTPPAEPEGVLSRPGDDVEAQQSASDFGVILLERTRLRPAGFTLGESLLSLSLAPGEEVTIEQKTFSERSVTYEEISEQDEEINTEVGSTFTTEMSEALSRVISDTTNKGVNAGGTVGLSYVVNLSVSAGYTDSITKALTDTQGETVRNVMVKSEKLASRRRAQHKISMKISETNRFETGNKRVLRNPNQFTPIDLVYFKLLQKVELSQERYGVRLCWAPFIRDPGVVLDQAEAAELHRLEKENPLVLPFLRPAPTAPAGNEQPESVNSGAQELNDWGFWGDMRADYWFTILPSNANYKWDGVQATIDASLMVSTTGFGARGAPGVNVVRAEPHFDADSGKNGCRVLIHAGADWGGAGAHLYIDFSVGFISNAAAQDAAYQADLAKWQSERDAYNGQVATLTSDRNAKIAGDLASWRTAFMKTFDPVSSAFQLLIALLFTDASTRDDGFEVEMWNKVFDFAETAFQYYPSWWNERGKRRADKSAEAFENASWMRVFLPIRPGFERQALNLILDRRVFTNTHDPRKTEAIDRVMTDLEKTRSTYFGGLDEIEISDSTPCPDVTRPSVCLAHWTDHLPTDSTHLEVVQAKTTAVDDVSETSIQDAHSMMTARIEGQQSQGDLTATLKDKVDDAALSPDIDVHIGIGTRPDEMT